MKIFTNLLFISFFGLTSSNWATEVDPNEPIAAEFSAEASWSDMHNYAQQRAEWFRQTLEVLTNDRGVVEDRLTLAKKIMPGLDETQIKVSSGLSIPLEGKYPKAAQKVFGGPIDLRDSNHILVCANSTDSK